MSNNRSDKSFIELAAQLNECKSVCEYMNAPHTCTNMFAYGRIRSHGGGQGGQRATCDICGLADRQLSRLQKYIYLYIHSSFYDYLHLFATGKWFTFLLTLQIFVMCTSNSLNICTIFFFCLKCNYCILKKANWFCT